MRTEVEDAVERLTAYASYLSAPAGIMALQNPYAVGGVPTKVRDLRTVLTALRAQAERVRVLEGERDEARGVVRETLWMARRYADGRQTYAVGMFNDAAMLAVAGGYASGEPDGTIFARDGSAPEYRSAEARAEAAERRAGELEGAMASAATQADAAKSSLMKSGRWTNDAGYMTDAALWLDRAINTMDAAVNNEALLPATQAEGEKERADDAALLADANNHYSEAQKEELARRGVEL